ncbi:MAG: hypothetical protein KAS29_20270, partial [Bacteroidales bacterium]|nr:hypothetical protein [Bacteroidales bacterium]
MAENKTQATAKCVPEFLEQIEDPARKADCKTISALMEKLSSSKPKMWGDSIVGIGDYRILPLVILFAAMTPFILMETIAQDRNHPGFSERVAERDLMVKDGIENYPYHPVEDPKVLLAMRLVPRHLFVP